MFSGVIANYPMGVIGDFWGESAIAPHGLQYAPSAITICPTSITMCPILDRNLPPCWSIISQGYKHIFVSFRKCVIYYKFWWKMVRNYKPQGCFIIGFRLRLIVTNHFAPEFIIKNRLSETNKNMFSNTGKLSINMGVNFDQGWGT